MRHSFGTPGYILICIVQFVFPFSGKMHRYFYVVSYAAVPGGVLLAAACGCAAEWGRIVTGGVTKMGLHFQRSVFC